jgi:serine protease Do
MPQSSFVQRRKRALMGAAASVLVLGLTFGPDLSPRFGVAPAAAQQRAEVAVRPASFADVVERVKPAVVAIQVRREDAANVAMRGRGGAGPEGGPNDPMWRFFREFRDRFGDGPGPSPQPQMSQGSGFFVSADGFIVTNNHVVQGGETFTVVMDDGTRIQARLVGSDPRTDIAVLKADRQEPFPFVTFSGAQPRIGDWVIAIGNPFGLGGSVTAGIVSARGRELGAGPYDDFIQIDAPVNRGNSGGPTFNIEGEVIGINTAIYSPSGGSVGIGFAIPATSASRVVDQIRQNGSVTRGWLGVQIQSINEEIARTLGLQRAEGALVAEPQPDSPAARAGIRSGDVIVGLNGQPVRDARDLTRRVAGLEPDQRAQFEILRNGERQTVEVQIGRLQEQQQARAGQGGRGQQGQGRGEDQDDGARTLASLGLEVSPGRGGGVEITDIDPRGQAARRGLRQGDVITEVGGQPVTSAKQLATALREAGQQGRPTVLARVRSQGGTRFVALPTDRS